MTTTVLAPYLTQEFFDGSGAPLAGGLLSSYQAGTVTPAATYTDNTGATPNSNPIVLNSRGEASVWVLPNVSYKFVLTDSAGNPIWTRDQVVNQQLISLYGGVDSGIVNAYVLNFAAPFTSYTDGTVIYFIPANSNTGPSTLNVNNLGVVAIINQNGTALVSNELLAGQVVTVMFKSGQFLLIQGAQQGLVSYGGTDTGTANNYVVSLTNQYFAYQPGNILFFVPSHTNTGASTINVKGLGPVSIAGLFGGLLIGGELLAGQLTELIFGAGGFFQIVSPPLSTGAFNFTAVLGGTGGGTPTCTWSKIGNLVTIRIPLIGVTSNATTFGLQGFANGLQGPTAGAASPCVPAVDNGVSGFTATLGIPSQVGGTTLSISINNASGNWTAAGAKQFGPLQFTYILS